jgi:hypothetical protein
MLTATATLPIRTAKATAKRPQRTTAARLKDPVARLVRVATFTPWLLAALLLAVSTPHLHAGFVRITGCSEVNGWLLAVAIDAAQVAAKMQLTLSPYLAVSVWARRTNLGIVLATAGTSAALNVLAFTQHADGPLGQVLAVTMGLLLPVLILSLSYSGASFALARPAKG